MITDFKEKVAQVNPEFLQFNALETLQVNVGNLCNLQCTHCHVQASPKGTKVMSKQVMDKIGIKVSVPRENQSNRNRDYKSYYIRETRDIVSDLYKNDLEVFGYRF